MRSKSTSYENGQAKSQIRALLLEGKAGQLEALLNTPPQQAKNGLAGDRGSELASHAAVVCHPHPLFGGTMHNKVVYHLAKTLNGFGFPVLRFNFRGAGRSQGRHDHGRGEIDDVRTAIEWLRGQYRLPIIFAGFSFGAAVGLRACCPDPRVVALISLGTPVQSPQRADPGAPALALLGREWGQDTGLVGGPVRDAEGESQFSFLNTCWKPKLFVSGGRDQFGPRQELVRLVSGLPEPKKLVLVEEADHFFQGHLPEVREAIQGWVRDWILRAP